MQTIRDAMSDRDPDFTAKMDETYRKTAAYTDDVARQATAHSKDQERLDYEAGRRAGRGGRGRSRMEQTLAESCYGA